MNTRLNASSSQNRQRGSVLIIVLWISFGLVAIALYYANSMSSELRVSDNRVSGLAAEQAIEGASRYISFVLTNLATNGAMPDVKYYHSEAVPVGGLQNDDDCPHFWLIGRDNNDINQLRQDEPVFGLIDEGSKLNLNTVAATNLQLLPLITEDFAAAIVDWRDPDDEITELGAESTEYQMFRPPYQCKNTNFTTLEELRLVYGATMDMLVGEDLNRNGVLDLTETDINRNGQNDLGLFEYTTVYTREPNSGKTNITDTESMQLLLENFLGTARAEEIVQCLGGTNTTGGATTNNNSSLLQVYLKGCMTKDEFDKVGTFITTTNSTYIYGRVNVNTAPAPVLACLPGMTPELAQQLINYRRSNPYNLYTVAWVVEALGENNIEALTSLASGDYITTQAYQFTADIAALGPYGRGYRRVKFIFDLSNGTPTIIYRQDLTHLGWALGKEVRQNWVISKKN